MAQKLKSNSPQKIFIKTFGCQMNVYDTNRILDFAKEIGFTQTTNLLDTNFFVLNTCHIREKSTEKVFHEIGRLKKIFRNKEKPFVVVTGCVAQAEGELIKKREKYIDVVLGPQSYHNIKKILNDNFLKSKKIDFTNFETIKKFDELKNLKNHNANISSFITIQEGCDKFCKFCVVPYTRGPECSRSFEDIIQEIKTLSSNGVKEITLLGQNVNSYNYNKKRLSDLIYSIEKINGIERIRYTTSHPIDMTQDLLEIHGFSKKLMPSLHLPVQSGSDRILKMMNRKHTKDFYLNIINNLIEKRKDIKFSSDFIIGYPGENENDFEESLNLFKKVKFINSYSFIYSSRPGTPSSNLKEVDKLVAKSRLIRFQSLADQIKLNYRKKLINREFKVLFENRIRNENVFFGRDEYNNSIVVESKKNIKGLIKNVEIVKINKNTLFGILTEKKDRKFAA